MQPGELMQLAVQAWLGLVVVSGVLWYAYQLLYKLPVNEVKQMASTAVHAAEVGADVAHKTVHAASSVAHSVGNFAGVETSLPKPEHVLGGHLGDGAAAGKGLGLGLVRKGARRVRSAGEAVGTGLHNTLLLLLPANRGTGNDSGTGDRKAALATAARLGFGLLLLAAASNAAGLGGDSSSSSRAGTAYGKPYLNRGSGSRAYRSATYGYGMAGTGSMKGSTAPGGVAGLGKGAVTGARATVGAAFGLAKWVVGTAAAVPAAVLGRGARKDKGQGSSKQSRFGASRGHQAGVMSYEDGTVYANGSHGVWGSAPGLVPGEAVLNTSRTDAAPGAAYGGAGAAPAAVGGSSAGLAASSGGAVQRGESGSYYLQQYRELLRQGSWR